MAAPRIPRLARDWTAPLRRAGYEPTEIAVHEADGATPCPPHDAALACPPCHQECQQGRTCPARTRQAANDQSVWHDGGVHPAEWLMLAIYAAVVIGPVAWAAARQAGWL